MATLVTKWFGAFVVEGGRVTDERRFLLDASTIAQRLARVRAGDVLDEERQLARGDVEVLEPRLKSVGRLSTGSRFFDLQLDEPDARILHDACVLLGREETKAAHGEADRFLAHAVRAMDEITVSANTLVERGREWYALHYPEASAHIPDAADWSQKVASTPQREALQRADPRLGETASIGVDFTEDQLAAVQGYAKALSGLYDERERLQTQVVASSRRLAPHLAAIVGDLLAAKLIAKAGSLQRLASAPAGTVQTLGAETALFHHLKDGKRPPKHGILFQHPRVANAPKWQRGKVSRILAAHALLAARIDFFGARKKVDASPLLARLEAQISRITKSTPRDRPTRPARGGPRARGRPR